ncbi:MAG TPA: hypothetical protein VF978_02025 [Gemmatimonadales bacterium]
MALALAALAHVAIALVLLMSRVGRAPEPRFITLAPTEPEEPTDLPPYGGARAGGGRAGGVRPAAPDSGPRRETGTPIAPTEVVPGPVAIELPTLPSGPRLGDGSLWVSPRPALPAVVADAIYGEPEPRDSIMVRRLRAIVDSLSVLVDSAQRERQLPTWTTEVAGKTFGIDSQYIHVAGIKIPTAALALLPITLPQGNFGEMERAEQLRDMRDDIMRSAQRTQTIEDFRRYVKELRARKQAERDAAQRTREQPKDTVRAIP